MFEEKLSSLLYSGQRHPKRILSDVKAAILDGMKKVAERELLNKISREGWVGGISYRWIASNSAASEKLVQWYR